MQSFQLFAHGAQLALGRGQRLLLMGDLLEQPAVVPVELQQLGILGRRLIHCLPQFELQGLQRLLVLPLFARPLLLGLGPEVFQRITRVLVLFFQGLQVSLQLDPTLFLPGHHLGAGPVQIPPGAARQPG